MISSAWLVLVTLLKGGSGELPQVSGFFFFFGKREAFRRARCDSISGKARIWVIYVYMLSPRSFAFLLSTALSLPLVTKCLRATSVRTLIASDVFCYQLSTVVGFSSLSPTGMYYIVIKSSCNFSSFSYAT